jgi:hypothetical protein
MNTLSIRAQANMPGSAMVTAEVRLGSGRTFYVCNPIEELTEAMAAGESFVAHSVVGMAPIEVIVNPKHVATIERKS